MHETRDFVARDDVPRVSRFGHLEPRPARSVHASALVQDLELDVLIDVMAGNEPLLRTVVERALLEAQYGDLETILYRQAMLRDCLEHPALIVRVFRTAVETLEAARKFWWWGVDERHPSRVLSTAVSLMQLFVTKLRQLRDVAAPYQGKVASTALSGLLAALRGLDDAYLSTVDAQLLGLEFRDGMLLGAQLGPWNAGTAYTLHKRDANEEPWLRRIFARSASKLSFRLHPRDEAGARILARLRDEGVEQAAVAVHRSADRIKSFFEMLMVESAFYVACLNLRDRLAALGFPTCFPSAALAGTRQHRYENLYDACLALTMQRGVVANSHDLDGRGLVIVTGANQGGKSSHLRAIGLAQLMMQSGMFVVADSFAADVSCGVYTHFKREEDASMHRGKLDEELERFSAIADVLRPDALLLLNESFAATNEREGSQIATDIVRALVDRRVTVFYVTHLFEFAHGMAIGPDARVRFLRAERRPDGTRTFQLGEGEPRPESHAEDVFDEVFGSDAPPSSSLQA